MPEETRYEENRAVGYERRDLDPRGMALFGIGLTITIGLVVVVVMLFQMFAAGRYARRQSPRPPIAVTRETTEPRLQVNAPAELRAIHEAEEKTLASYGWIDPAAGTVRIPIDRAIEILAQKGLPARTEGKK
jgi:hypothetical protein